MTREDWEVVKIGDVAKVISGYAFKAKDFLTTGIPVIKIKNIRIGNVEFDNDSSYVDVSFLDVVDEKFITKDGDILISLTGSHITQPSSVVGRVGRYTLQYPSILNQRAGKFIIKDKSITDQGYLYYVAYNPVFRYKVASFAQGSASQANVSPGQVESIEISLPPLAEQQRIASILSAYDDLIENNTRRIALLEQMAQTLYRQWFVAYKFPGYQDVEMVDSGTEFGMIPQGWEVKKIGEMVENFDNQRKPLSTMVRLNRQGEYPYYGAAKIIDYIDDYIFDGKYLLLAEDGSVITTQGKPVLQYVDEKFWVSNHAHILRGKGISTDFLYIYLSQVDIGPYITGAAQPKISQGNLNRIPILIPSGEVLALFNSHIEQKIIEIFNLQKQNQSLKGQRDLLLRKLIG